MSNREAFNVFEHRIIKYEHIDIVHYVLISKYHLLYQLFLIIGIKHVFPCINVCQVPRELLKTEAERRGFQQHPRDLANVNALKNNV